MQIKKNLLGRVMAMNKDELLEKIEKDLDSLSQDELYDLLVECGLKGLTKLKNGEKGTVILTGEKRL